MADSSDSSSSPASNGNSLKRKRTHRTSDSRKRPSLEEGTSYPFQASELAKKRLAQLKNSLLNELGGRPNTYVYTPLKHLDGEEIRVLVIEPGKNDDPIRCRLVPSSLPNTPSGTAKTYKYTALSYFWGEGEPIHEITMTTYKSPKKKLKKLDPKEKLVVRWMRGKDWCNTGKMYVRSNLYVALKRFREEDEPVTMWIDALCIDQDYGPERTAQVKKMHELYIHAEKVSIYLGDGTNLRQPPAKPCFKFLKKLLNLSGLDDLLEDLAEDKEDLVENASNIISLMRNKWFSRRWVVQELALARDAEVVYGSETMGWKDFADSIAVFIKNEDRILPALSRKIAERAVSIQEISPFDGLKNLGANALVDFTNNLFRRSDNGDIQQRMMTLEMLVSSLLAFESGDPRDTIFAVLSLAKDTHRMSKETGERELDKRLQPIYEKDKKCLLDVYTDFIEYCIGESKSLDILLRHWAPSGEKERKKKRLLGDKQKETEEEEEELPTWIPLISKSSHGSPSQRAGGRIGGDSFVGTSLRTGQRNYSATLDLLPNIEFGRLQIEEDNVTQQEEEENNEKKDNKKYKGKKQRKKEKLERKKQRENKKKQKKGKQSDGQGKEQEVEKKKHCYPKKYNGHLFVKGLRIGRIKELAPRSPQGMIFHEAFDMAKFDQKWWNRYQEWAHDIPRVPEDFWRTLVADRGFDGTNPPSWFPRAFMECLNNLWANGDLRPDDVIGLPRANSMAKLYLSRVKEVMWERKFVRIDLNERKDTYGLLPPQANEKDIICVLFGCSVPVVLREKEEEDGTYFQMVGECYIHNMMEGEAVSGKAWIYPYEDAECFELR